MLLPLVIGVVLVLVGVTASALVAIVSKHLEVSTLNGAVARDAALVELFVNSALTDADVDADGPTAARAAELSAQLASLTDEDQILRIELRSTDGSVLVTDAAAEPAWPVPDRLLAEVVAGRPDAGLVGAGNEPPAQIRELLPLLDRTGSTTAIVALWRDATPLTDAVDTARRDVMVVTLAAGALLATLLVLLYRSAQARLSRQHAQLLDATRRDPLTGLLTHGAVVALLADAVEAAHAEQRPIAVALLDIDNFRLLNDTHGHAAGDDVLRRVAEAVRAQASSTIEIARYGPDELLVVHRGTEEAEARRAVEAVRRRIGELAFRFGESEELPVSVSAGIAVYPTHARSVTALLSVAALALTEAKASGGDRVAVARIGEEDRVVLGSLDVLQGLVLAVDTKDRYTKRHSEDVARYAVYLARRLGLDDATQRSVQLAGLLHDVGKIGIPDVILRKPSKLTADEYAMFHQHVALGDAIVRDVPDATEVRAGIRHHHERWDGGGYLDGLAGEEIPLVARIISVADTFSAMTTTRPYRKALPVDEAIRRLRDASGTQLQPELVETFVTGLETDASAPMPNDEPGPLWTAELSVA
jgi:diguanylate cyclase (GGDEF)-like protein/putative nucleotidyltransferase with HDIG domain